MKKHMLMDVFEHARLSESPYVFVLIEAEGTDEIVVVPNKSFNDKQAFYNKAYSDDLKHVMNKDVFIKRFDYGNADKLKFII